MAAHGLHAICSMHYDLQDSLCHRSAVYVMLLRVAEVQLFSAGMYSSLMLCALVSVQRLFDPERFAYHKRH